MLLILDRTPRLSLKEAQTLARAAGYNGCSLETFSFLACSCWAENKDPWKRQRSVRKGGGREGGRKGRVSGWTSFLPRAAGYNGCSPETFSSLAYSCWAENKDPWKRQRSVRKGGREGGVNVGGRNDLNPQTEKHTDTEEKTYVLLRVGNCNNGGCLHGCCYCCCCCCCLAVSLFRQGEGGREGRVS